MNSINNILDFFSEKTILVIGDVMIDEYIWGRVERISPEAPIPIVAVEKKEHRLGGAANVALNIRSLGANVIIASVIGKDVYGDLFFSLCRDSFIKTDAIIISEYRPTTCKTRVIGQKQHLLRVDSEVENPLLVTEQQALMVSIEKVIDNNTIDAIIFEDYDKGCITPELINNITELAIKNNIPITVDPKHRNFMHYKKVSLFKPNLKELAIGLKIDIRKDKLIEELPLMCGQFMQQQKHKAVMITLSEQGMFVMNDSGVYYHIPTQARDVADVSGAGDTVIATATLCLTAGLSLNEIARISNIAAGIVCEKVGVVPVDKQELRKRI